MANTDEARPTLSVRSRLPRFDPSLDEGLDLLFSTVALLALLAACLEALLAFRALATPRIALVLLLGGLRGSPRWALSLALIVC